MKSKITRPTGLAAATLCALAFASPARSGEAATPAPTSSATPAAPATGGIQAGQKAPDFTLRDTDGKEHSLASLLSQGKTVVLEWFNPDCPFVKYHHATSHTMTDLAKSFSEKNVVWLAINSGAPGSQGAGLDRNKKAKKDYKMEYPILIDEAGTVGRAYGAKTTPHMFVIGKDGRVVYAGAIDSDRELKAAEKTNYVERALSQYLAGEAITMAQTTSYGCSVKYSKSMSSM
jgi:peroxiredoxin